MTADFSNTDACSKKNVDSSTQVKDIIEWLRDYSSRKINSLLMDERRSIPPYIIDETNRLTGFVLDAESAGISHGPEILTLGMRGMVQNPIYFKDVCVGAECLLGETHKGMNVAQSAMMLARTGLCCLSVGAMKRCLQLVLSYSSQRLVGTGVLLNNPYAIVLLSNLSAGIQACSALADNSVLHQGNDELAAVLSIACKMLGLELSNDNETQRTAVWALHQFNSAINEAKNGDACIRFNQTINVACNSNELSKIMMAYENDIGYVQQRLPGENDNIDGLLMKRETQKSQ